MLIKEAIVLKIYENFKIVCDFMTVLKKVYEDNTHRSFF